MKITKILLSAALLSTALAFTSCGGSPDAGSGNNGPFLLSNNGETVEINYTNNTEEVQKFMVFAGIHGFDRKGRYTIYDTGDSNYEFGVFIDYDDTDPDVTDPDLLSLRTNLITYHYMENGRIDLSVAYSRNIDVQSSFLNFDFDSFATNTKTNSFVSDYENGIDTLTYFCITKDNTNNISVHDSNGFKDQKVSTGVLKTLDTKFGYILIIQPGSTCHLKFELQPLNN